MRAHSRLITASSIIAVLPLAAALGATHRLHARQAKAGGACAARHVRTLLSGRGWLENLEFDGRGAITLSANAEDRILRLRAGGRLSTLVAGVKAPGAERVLDGYLYFNTGDGLPVAPTGTIERVNLRTGKRSTWARRLTMPNGLALLPNGDAIVSRDLLMGAPPTGLTRVRARDRVHPQFQWAKLDDTNGLAVDPTGRWLYVDRTFSSDGEVDRVLIADPRRVQVAGRLGAGVLPDDLAVDAHGILYIAGFGTGKIYRLDPRTHASCAIASGLDRPTSARFGGSGWKPANLYVTDAGGHLSEVSASRSGAARSRSR